MLDGLIFFCALSLLGWLGIGIFDDDLSKLEELGLAYGLGAGFYTFAVFLASLIGTPVSLAIGTLLYLLLTGMCLWILRRRHKRNLPSLFLMRNLPQLSALEITLLCIIGAAIFVIALLAAYWQPYAWDSLAIWVLKGKLIAATESLVQQSMATHPFYPLNIPLQVAYLYLLNSDFTQIIFPVYFISLVLVFFSNLKQWAGKAVALLCTLFLSTIPYLLSQSAIAYANVPFAFYYISSTVYLYRFLRERRPVWLVLSGILIGFAGWTRSEALLYFAINTAVLILFSPKDRETFKHLATFATMFAILWAPWTIYAQLAGYGSYFGIASGGLREIVTGQFDATRLNQIIDYFAAHTRVIEEWGFLWLLFPAAIVIGFRHMREHAALLTLIILNLLGVLYTYYAAGTDPSSPLGWWISTGFDRMELHWTPLIIFYFGLTLKESSIMEDVMKSFRVKIDPYLILLVFFSFFAIGPLLAPGYFWGAHDGRHSVYFLFEFDRVIQDGILYPRWLPDFTFGYGYPFFNIYAPGAFYIGEALHLIGFDFVTATKIVFALAILLAGPAMFGFVKRLTGSSQAAFLSGLAYVYIPYHIADVYVRAALAESVALIFLPLTLWGFYETVVNPKRTTIVAAALAYGAMWFTHNGIALLFTPVLGIWVLFLMIGELRKKENRSFRSHLSSFIFLGLPPLAALALGIGLVGIFLIPMALEYQYVRVDQWTANYYDYSNHFVYFSQLFNPTWGFGISVPGPHDTMSFQLGAVPTLLAIFSIITFVKNPNGIRRFWLFFLMMTVIVILLMLGFSLPIWEALRLVTFAQFPWRLLTLTTLSLAVLAGVIVMTYEQENHTRGISLPTLLLGLLIVLGSSPYLTAQMQLEAQEGPVSILGLFRFQQSAGEMTGSTAWVKEIPNWSPMADVYFAGKKLKSRIDYTHIDSDKLWIGVLPNFMGLHSNGERIAYNAQEDNLPITFNVFYYPGWRAYLVKPWSTDIIRELPIEVIGELGRIQVRVPKGQDQWLLLRFDDTPPRIVGSWISALSILLALGLLIGDVRNRRKDEGGRRKDE